MTPEEIKTMNWVTSTKFKAGMIELRSSMPVPVCTVYQENINLGEYVRFKFIYINRDSKVPLPRRSFIVNRNNMWRVQDFFQDLKVILRDQKRSAFLKINGKLIVNTDIERYYPTKAFIWGSDDSNFNDYMGYKLAVYEDKDNNIEYEGVWFFINDENNTCFIKRDDLEAFIYNVSKLDFDVEGSLLATGVLIGKTQSFETRAYDIRSR